MLVFCCASYNVVQSYHNTAPITKKCFNVFNSPTHVLLFGLTTGTLGLSILLAEVNGLTALLGTVPLIINRRQSEGS